MTAALLDRRARWDGILRKFYGCALADVDLAVAADLVREMKPVAKFMRGEDPDSVSPAEWFALASTPQKE